MAQATQAGRAIPQAPKLPPRRGWRDPRGHPGRRDPRLRCDRPVRAEGPSIEPATNPAVLESGVQWELQRRQQSGDVDPLTEAQREWERQRRLQSVG